MDDALRLQLITAKQAYERRDYPAAVVLLEAVASEHDRFADVYNMLGVIYHDDGQFAKAQAAFTAALRLNPTYTEAALNLAVLYNDLGKYAEARETYGHALAQCTGKEAGSSQDPFVAGKIANMHAETGDAYRAAGMLEQAIGEFEKAVTLRPTFADLRAKLAAALIEHGQLPLAAKELERALKDRPEYLPAHIALGTCYYSMGRLGEAIRVWEEVLKVSPSNGRAKMFLRLVNADVAARPNNA